MNNSLNYFCFPSFWRKFIQLTQVNQFVLQKQHLTYETRSNDILRIVIDIGGLHSTGPTVPYLSLLSRTKKFTKDKLDEELYVKKNLGKIRYVRKTVYILPKEMIPPAFAATRKMIVPTSEKY